MDAVFALADRHYIIERGRAVWAGSSGAFRAHREIQHR